MSAVADPRDRSFVIRPTIYTPPPGRKRLRDLGIVIGRFPTGPLNAITDVAGVRVGHTTLIDRRGAARLGQGPGPHRHHRHHPDPQHLLRPSHRRRASS